MNDNSDVQKNWLEVEFDGSPEWWYNKNKLEQSNGSKEEYYQQVRDMVAKKKRYQIPVHRSHEAWQDLYWLDLFNEFKVVTVHINQDDATAMHVLQSNIIKKIWWQEFRTLEDLNDELIDKCRKHNVDYDAVMTVINRFSGYTNYTDMMLAINMIKHHDKVPSHAVDVVYEQISERWNDYNIEQHSHKLPCDHLIVNYGSLFVNRDYNEYKRMCIFLGMVPWEKDIWLATIDEYMDQDTGTNMITMNDVSDRLWLRVTEAVDE